MPVETIDSDILEGLGGGIYGSIQGASNEELAMEDDRNFFNFGPLTSGSLMSLSKESSFLEIHKLADPTSKYSTTLCKRCPMIEKEEGHFVSYFTISNNGKSPIAYRVMPSKGTDQQRYNISPSYGCLNSHKCEDVLVFTNTSGESKVTYDMLTNDAFVVQVIPIQKAFQFAETAKWFFDNAVYFPKNLLILGYKFTEPAIITRQTLVEIVQFTDPKSQLLNNVPNNSLDKLCHNSDDLEFIRKILLYYFNKNDFEEPKPTITLSRFLFNAVVTVLMSVTAHLGWKYAIPILLQPPPSLKF